MAGLVMLAPVLAVASPPLALLNYFALLVWKRLAFWIPHEDKQSDKNTDDPSAFIVFIKFILVPLLILVGLSATYRQHFGFVTFASMPKLFNGAM